MRRVIIALGLLAAGVAAGLPAAAQAGRSAHAASNHRVLIRNYAYSPAHVVIHRNDTVTWLFDDGSTAHNVIAKGFRSSPTRNSGSYTVRFAHPGTFSYLCTVHPWMTGTVVVH